MEEKEKLKGKGLYRNSDEWTVCIWQRAEKAQVTVEGWKDMKEKGLGKEKEKWKNDESPRSYEEIWRTQKFFKSFDIWKKTFIVLAIFFFFSLWEKCSIIQAVILTELFVVLWIEVLVKPFWYARQTRHRKSAINSNSPMETGLDQHIHRFFPVSVNSFTLKIISLFHINSSQETVTLVTSSSSIFCFFF